MNPPRILVVGSINQDLVVRVSRPPRPGETIAGGDLQLHPGGKGANQAVAAARLGASATMLGKVGRDAFGPAMLQTLQTEGVDTAFVSADDEAATGTAVIAVFDSGENTIVISPGANGRVRPADLAALEPRMGRFDFLLLQLEIPMETVEAAAGMARRAGVRVLLDAAPARALPPSLLANVDIVSPNETEAETLVGRPVTTEDEALEAARELMRQGAREALIKRGARGSLWAHPDGVERFGVFDVQAVDPTAAGDAFTAAIALGLARGLPRSECLRFASAAGAMTVTRLGAQPSLPRAQEVEEFLRTR
ncbi:MAG: ribokinase [Candidatus Sumerlaeota bacterium]|nr:ribokinase [Candidatus Sumerlaeota bacterium]